MERTLRPSTEPVGNGTFTRSFDVLLIATSPKSEEVADLLCHSPQMMGYRSPASARLVRSSAVRARISLREMQCVHLIVDNHGACLIKSQLLLISGSMCSLGFGQRNQEMRVLIAATKRSCQTQTAPRARSEASKMTTVVQDSCMCKWPCPRSKS